MQFGAIACGQSFQVKPSTLDVKRARLFEAIVVGMLSVPSPQGQCHLSERSAEREQFRSALVFQVATVFDRVRKTPHHLLVS